MLYESLLLLKAQLNAYFSELHERITSIDPNPVVLENIAALSETQLLAAHNIYLTQINLVEEASLRNSPHFRRQDERTIYEQPPVYINLHILFSVVMRSNYETALLHLSHLIKYFQGQTVFHNKMTPDHHFGTQTSFKLTMELYSPTLEQVNYLWSTLGGKQYPFALYTLRVLEMKRESLLDTGIPVTEIILND